MFDVGINGADCRACGNWIPGPIRDMRDVLPLGAEMAPEGIPDLEGGFCGLDDEPREVQTSVNYGWCGDIVEMSAHQKAERVALGIEYGG